MAMCAPTAWTRAATLLNDEQSRVSHTVNVRSVPSTGGLAATAAGAPGAVPCSWNDAVAPELPVTDCGTTRYSAESAALFAGNVTHPESDAGSTEVYAPTASVICVARPPHAASGSGPAG